MRSLRRYINDTEKFVIIPGAYMVPRSQMPQIRDQDAFLKFLSDNDMFWVETKFPTEKIIPLQSMVDRKKIAKLSLAEIDKLPPIVLSEDGHIIDGHHRFFAVHDTGASEINAIVVMGHTNKVFKLAQEFDSNG